MNRCPLLGPGTSFCASAADGLKLMGIYEALAVSTDFVPASKDRGGCSSLDFPKKSGRAQSNSRAPCKWKQLSAV